jgi:hypothetical protein
MLKGKKSIYVLIPLNILIWTFFIYRFYSAYHESDEPFSGEKTLKLEIADIKDSVKYTLRLAYADPFLKKETQHNVQGPKEPKEEPKQNSVKNVVKPKEAPRLMPDIKYLGLVKNNTSGSVTAIISINGSSKLIKQDETIEGLCFKNFTTENLTVLWNKEKIVIAK